MSRRGWIAVCAALFIGLALTAADRAAALTTPNQFCIGDPCVISGTKDANPNIVLDFGARAVILQGTLNMLPLGTGDIGSLTIKARSFTISGSGQIKGFGNRHAGGSLTINAVTTIQINDTVGSGAIRLSGQDGGALTLTTTTGAVNVFGRVTLFGDGVEASGGSLSINAATDINLAGELDNGGGLDGTGGDVDLTAGGNVLTGLMDLSAGEIGGGFLDISAGGSVTLGETDMSGGGLGGDAGFLTIDAGGNVRFHELFRGRGADHGQDCGDGAEVDVTAGGDITIAAEFDIRGRGLDCWGGSLTLDAARVFVQSEVMMSGTGTEGVGGDLDITTTSLTRINSTMELDGGDGGGDVSIVSDGELELFGNIVANGRTSVGAGPGVFDLVAGKLTISGDIDAASGSASADGTPMLISACDITVNSSSLIEATGNGGSITIEARDTLALHGQFRASNGGIAIRYSAQANPPDISGASFSPSPSYTLDPSLTPCRVCETDDDCADADPCTDDVCNVTACTNTLREGKPCSDGNPCTVGDACMAGVCVSGPLGTCNDLDGDGKVDDADECTTISWTPEAMRPPNQNPARFQMLLKRISAGEAKQRILIKGLFAVALSQQLLIDPTANGVHLYIEDAAGPVLDVSLPGGPGCVLDEGWTTFGVGFGKTWRYRNETGSLPPACGNGSALGVQSIKIKDRRLSKGGLQFKIIAVESTLRQLVLPLTRIQFSLGLAAQTFPGVATDQAKAGQCAEALFTGNPIPSGAAPSCRAKMNDAEIDTLLCKGK